jgi:hypothetical protein
LEPLNSAAMWSTDVEEIVLVKGEKGLGFSILDYQVNTDPARNLFVERSSTKEFTRQNKKYWKKKNFLLLWKTL